MLLLMDTCGASRSDILNIVQVLWRQNRRSPTFVTRGPSTVAIAIMF